MQEWFSQFGTFSYNFGDRSAVCRGGRLAAQGHAVITVNATRTGQVAYARFTPNSRGTWDWRTTKKMAKIAVTRELVGKVVCSSYVTHQKVISYSWILAITRAYSSLKSTSSTTDFNCQKTVVELVNFTCEWPNSRLDPSLVASLCRLVVTHSVASYVVRHGRKSVASDT